MLLQGSIRRFRLADLLQFLAAEDATGVLEVRDFEEYGYIYLVEGAVEGISLPLTDEKLGSRLVKAGLLSEEKLGQVLLEHATMSREEKRRQPLGQLLVERGYLAEQAVHDIMARQTLDQVFELAHWQYGMFLYDEPEEMPTFTVKLQGDVQELLLDAYRRIDEGQLARKARRRQIESEVCFACPAAAECGEEVRRKYLRADHCLWRELAALLDEQHEQLRDARNLYRSRAGDQRPQLEAMAEDDGPWNGDGSE
ncbi:MAG: DUF4388 domain-containing protein [Actinobacteria bacterium]|nr:DUF4388 domain-containing protein [Actinomycetota bacterium]